MLWSCQLTSQCLKCCDVTIVAPIGNSFAQEITLIDQNIFGFQLFQLFTRFKYFFFANKFYDSFFFFLKIAKRVKENKRLSNFRNIACQLVTEIGQTCGIGLIVSNQRLILFCIIQMTFFLISLLNTLYIHTTESTYALNAIFVMSLRFVSFFSAHRCTLCKRLSCVEQEARSKGKFMQ